MQVFVSVGTGLSDVQEAFVGAVEARLRAIGLEPCTIGRNRFSPDAPLHAVVELMDQCSGVVVVALERYHFAAGTERRGSSRQRTLEETSLPTSWNQIEASMAYSRGLPLLVLVDEALHRDGLLEKGHDWFVHALPVDPGDLNTPTFAGLLDSWRGRIGQAKESSRPANQVAPLDLGKMSLGEIAGRMRPGELWALLVAIAAALAGAFALGVKLGG